MQLVMHWLSFKIAVISNHPTWLITAICLRIVLILSSIKSTQRHPRIIEIIEMVYAEPRPHISWWIKIMKLNEIMVILLRFY